MFYRDRPGERDGTKISVEPVERKPTSFSVKIHMGPTMTASKNSRWQSALRRSSICSPIRPASSNGWPDCFCASYF